MISFLGLQSRTSGVHPPSAAQTWRRHHISRYGWALSPAVQAVRFPTTANTLWHDMMGAMGGTRVNRMMRAIVAVFGVIAALLMCGPTTGIGQAAVAAPAGDAIAIGDPNALGVVDLFVDPMCPFSGQMVQEQGDEIGQRIEGGTLRVNLRFVDFLDKYSASKTYDIRAIYAAFVVGDQSRSSEVTWRFVQQIFSDEQQPEEGGDTDLDNNQLADLANRVGAPPPAQDLIRLGLPIGFDARAIAANNLTALREFPEPGVPLIVMNGEPVDGNTDWLDKLPG
jgi:protein-disulfide isomerase